MTWKIHAFVALVGGMIIATYGKYLDNQVKQTEITRRRREADGFDQMVKKNGIYRKDHGQAGIIYYVQDGSACEIGFNNVGSDYSELELNPSDLESWSYPGMIPLNPREKMEMEKDLNTWLMNGKVKWHFRK